jgi:membrane-associated phospholipid phosphatase
MLRRPVVLIAAAGACVVTALAAYVAALHVGVLQRADLRVLTGFVGVQTPRSYRLATDLSELFNPAPFAVLAVAVVAIGVARGRVRAAACAGAAMLAANVTTQLLKDALPSVRPSVPGALVGDHAWPSGHATAAMSLALALVLVSPPRLRPAATAAGGLVAVAVAYAVLLLGWHYPSDVVGGYLVATGWTCVAAAVALRRPAAAPVRVRAALGPSAVAGGVLLLALAVLVAVRPAAVSAYASDHTTFAVGAAALAAEAVVLAAAMSAALSSQR